ncbi:unnamed protein product [Bursaphelenchus okinawaensis]|uniref:cyclin-dependent kinase n=1 Tax=Bursaphelenchus okinawaensis TaxID=465554 RepID=A0A811K8B2_9BILA|nr:unnamed protein product [Bursaphelenchus okinawaensis]CAG9095711.1 unnamed protein product [Bursaphelenchus okinawaensis]
MENIDHEAVPSTSKSANQIELERKADELRQRLLLKRQMLHKNGEHKAVNEDVNVKHKHNEHQAVNKHERVTEHQIVHEHPNAKNKVDQVVKEEDKEPIVNHKVIHKNNKLDNGVIVKIEDNKEDVTSFLDVDVKLKKAEELRLRLLLKQKMAKKVKEEVVNEPEEKKVHYVQSSPSTDGELDEYVDVGRMRFENMTEEQKGQLSPGELRHKEYEYQQRLISELPLYYPGISGTRTVKEYKFVRRIEEGTFGIVYEAIELDSDTTVALKKLKMEKEREGFPITSLREINMLMKCRMHKNIVRLIEIVTGSTMDKFYLVMEYIPHDVRKLIKLMEKKKKRFTIAQIKALMLQLVDGLAYMHSEWVIHRDLKPSNLLLTHDNVLKIGDFGLCREYGDPLKPYTPVVVTLWYRCPELLLGSKLYSTKVDMWSVGCILGEFLTLEPMFKGRSELDQLNKIFLDTGVPNETVWPEYKTLPGIVKCIFPPAPFNQLRSKYLKAICSENGLDLLQRLLALCPDRRISAEDALKHKFFEEKPEPASSDSFPSWPDNLEKVKPPPVFLDPP